MSIFQSISVDEICRRSSLGKADVLALRHAFYDTDLIAETEADTLLTINRACHIQDPAWTEFLVEAVTEYIVNDVEPRGYVNAANARWLVSRTAENGAFATRSEHELLVNVLDKARWLPESLAGLALREVHRAIVDGTGPLRVGGGIEAGRITGTDVHLIRRILFAFGGGRAKAISRTEADVLLDIQAALAAPGVSPAWSDLLVKCVANVALQLSGYAVPRREEALMRATGLDDRADGDAGGGCRVEAADIGLGGYVVQTDEERALDRLERQRLEIITAEPICEATPDWLADRLRRTALPSEAAAALQAACARDGLKLHPDLAAAMRPTEIAA